jgi:hypothetical protein
LIGARDSSFRLDGLTARIGTRSMPMGLTTHGSARGFRGSQSWLALVASYRLTSASWCGTRAASAATRVGSAAIRRLPALPP